MLGYQVFFASMWSPRIFSSLGMLLNLAALPPSCNHLHPVWVRAQSLSRSDSLWPHGLNPTRLSAHESFWARILECIAISFSRGSSWLRDWTQTHISCVSFTGRQILYHWAIWFKQVLCHHLLATLLPAGLQESNAGVSLTGTRADCGCVRTALAVEWGAHAVGFKGVPQLQRCLRVLLKMLDSNWNWWTSDAYVDECEFERPWISGEKKNWTLSYKSQSSGNENPWLMWQCVLILIFKPGTPEKKNLQHPGIPLLKIIKGLHRKPDGV